MYFSIDICRPFYRFLSLSLSLPIPRGLLLVTGGLGRVCKYMSRGFLQEKLGNKIRLDQ